MDYVNSVAVWFACTTCALPTDWLTAWLYAERVIIKTDYYFALYTHKNIVKQKNKWKKIVSHACAVQYSVYDLESSWKLCTCPYTLTKSKKLLFYIIQFDASISVYTSNLFNVIFVYVAHNYFYIYF